MGTPRTKRPSRPKPTPLASYLARTPGLTPSLLAARLEAELGWRPSLMRMGHWLNGRAAPRADVLLALEAVTGGAVTCRAWVEWRAATSRQGSSLKRSA